MTTVVLRTSSARRVKFSLPPRTRLSTSASRTCLSATVSGSPLEQREQPTGGKAGVKEKVILNDTTTSDTIQNPSRPIELDVDIGADARDWNSIQSQEKLKPVETDLRRIEEMVADIVTEMEYLRAREQRLRDTNESTNERVKWFAFGTMGMLIGLGAWQVVYLRAYFRYVELSLWWKLELVTDCSVLADLSTLFRFTSPWNGCIFDGSFFGFAAVALQILLL